MCADRAQHVGGDPPGPGRRDGGGLRPLRRLHAGLSGLGGGVDLASLETLVRFATGGLQPHLTVLINLDVRLGLERKPACVASR